MPRRAPGRRALGAAAGLLAAALGVAALVAVRGPAAPEPGAPPLVVATERAAPSERYTTKRHFSGRVEAARRAAVGFELGGLLAELRVDEGDAPDAGAVLARLDTERLEARRAELAALRDQAKAELALAESTRERFARALERDAVSVQEWDEAAQRAAARRAALARARGALRRVQVDLRKATLRAPFDAVVVERRADEGAVVAEGEPVLALLERTRPEARVGVTAEAAGALAVGEAHPLRLRGRELDARVKAILPIRSEATRTVDVVFRLEAELDGIRVGDLAELRLERSVEAPGFWLPTSALAESARGLWAAYVAEPIEAQAPERDADPRATHRLVRRQLELLHHGDGRVYVRGTLEAGERVVTEGLHRLAPELPVRLAGGDARTAGGAP